MYGHVLIQRENRLGIVGFVVFNSGTAVLGTVPYTGMFVVIVTDGA